VQRADTIGSCCPGKYCYAYRLGSKYRERSSITFTRAEISPGDMATSTNSEGLLSLLTRSKTVFFDQPPVDLGDSSHHFRTSATRSGDSSGMIKSAPCLSTNGSTRYNASPRVRRAFSRSDTTWRAASIPLVVSSCTLIFCLLQPNLKSSIMGCTSGLLSLYGMLAPNSAT